MNDVINYNDLGITSSFSTNDLAAVPTNSFTPRIQLKTSASNEVKAKTFPVDHYALIYSNQPLIDLGERVDVLVLAKRPVAMDMSDKEHPIFVHYPKCDENGQPTGEFKRIMDKSILDMTMKVSNKTCSYGNEFLLYIPVKKTFATLSCTSVSGKWVAPFIEANIHKPVTLSSVFHDKGANPFQKMHVTECSTPFDAPDMGNLKVELQKFLNPVDAVAETIDDGGKTRER